MKEIDSHEARTRLSQILRAVSGVKKFLIANYGKSIAKLASRIPPGRDVSEIVADLSAFQTQKNCKDVSLEDLGSAVAAGRL